MGASKCDLSCAMAATNWDADPARRPPSEISARALQEFHLRPPPGAKLTNLADLPFDISFEPQLKPSRPQHQHLGGKILKLLKLLRKPKSAPPLPVQVFHQPPLRVLHFQDLISQSTQFPTLDVLTKSYHYDSDEHPQMSSSSSRTSNSEAESTRSSGSHLSNSQFMANILIFIMDEEDVASEDVIQTMVSLDGPHESAWHQPRDETTLVESPTARGRQSAAASMKHSRGGPRSYAVAGDGLLMSPGPSRRFGKLDLSRTEVYKFR